MLDTIVMQLLRQLWLLFGYLAGGAFPQPLSPEEEREALERLERGDEAARELLIERNLRLVAHVVKKFDNVGEDPEDLIQIGTLGLIKGVDTYRRDKGTRLATYVAKCIENEILMHIRVLRRTRGEVSLYDPIGVDREGNEITLMDVLGTEADVVQDRVATEDECRELRRQLALLGEKERRVLELRYGIATRRRTQREIARMLGISRSYVSRIENGAPIPMTALHATIPTADRRPCAAAPRGEPRAAGGA